MKKSAAYMTRKDVLIAPKSSWFLLTLTIIGRRQCNSYRVPVGGLQIRYCMWCKQWLPLARFQLGIKVCFSCRSKTDRRKSKLEVLKNYGEKCACCGEGEIEFLTIDHIEGGGGLHRKKLRDSGEFHIYRWLKKNHWPKGYRVLCLNCNGARGFFGYCPHETPSG